MILVTGSGGVLGHAIAAELRKGLVPYRLLTRADVDLRDPQATLDIFRTLAPRMVLHLAGRVHGLMGNRVYPGEMFADNVKMNMSVIDAARASGCERFVGVSTVAVYPGEASMPIAETSIWMGLPHASEQAYAHAKRAMLAQLQAYKVQYGFSYAYPILTNIYGPGDRFDKVNGHVIPSLVAKFFEAARSGQSVEVWGSGAAERDFIHAADAARAILSIADNHEGAINVASGRVVRIRDIVEILQKHSGVRSVVWDKTKPDGQMMRRYDVSMLKDLPFVPEVRLEDGLAQTYDWFAQNHPNVRTN